MTGPGNMRRKSLDMNSFVSRKEAMGLAQYYAGRASEAAAKDTKAMRERLEALEGRVAALESKPEPKRKLFG